MVFGQKSYVYHFLVAVELPAGFGWCHTFTACHRHDADGIVENYDPKLSDAMDPIPAGATGVATGTIGFDETEQGWTARHPLIPFGGEGYCPPKTPPQACYKNATTLSNTHGLALDKLN